MTARDAAASPPAVRRPLVLAAVMATSFTIAIEATIVSTAMPQIASRFLPAAAPC